MLIYGNTPGDIVLMIKRKKWKVLPLVVLFVLFLFLVGCGTANTKGTSMSEFWKAIGSGDISVLKKLKGAKDKEDGSWEKIEHNSAVVE